jgi:hypothetical protein
VRRHRFLRPAVPFLCSCALALVAGGDAGAQNPTRPDSVSRADSAAPAQSTLGAVIGSIYDSVHTGPLTGAAVLVVGSPRMAFTTERGAFGIDSITPGTYRLRIEHPVLDSLGVQFVTDSFTVTPGGRHAMSLAVPSNETLVALSCPAARRRLGPSAIIGRVLDADTDAPVDSVRVSFVWQQLSLTAGLKNVAVIREARSDADGVFRICGIPNDVEGTLQAEKGPIRTSEVKITFQGQPLIVQGLRIGNTATVARVAADSARAAEGAQPRFSRPVIQRGQAVLTGRVVAANGQPMVGARVDVQGTESVAQTNQAGEFRLTDLPSGTQTVVARQIGFAPVEQAVNLSTRAPATVTITMSQPAQVLSPVVVEAERDRGLERVGFQDRKRALSGYFLTGDDVMKRGPNMLTDVFRTVPSLRVERDGLYDYKVVSSRATMLGANCVRFFIDGTPYRAIYPGDVDRMMPPSEIGGIEVYDGSSSPIQFQVAGESACTTIVIWSKFRLSQANRRSR